MPGFEPAPFQIINTPEQLKAFTDPLRSRVLSILNEREATNQQIADMLDQPHARVLHHIKALLDMGLITLVEARVTGGNVEKYYRAVARMFGLRAPAELKAGIAEAEFEALRQEVAASARAWPHLRLVWETRKVHMTAERAEQFYGRLNELIAEYWGGPDQPPPEDAGEPMMAFAAVMYRDPHERGGGGQGSGVGGERGSGGEVEL